MYSEYYPVIRMRSTTIKVLDPMTNPDLFLPKAVCRGVGARADESIYHDRRLALCIHPPVREQPMNVPVPALPPHTSTLSNNTQHHV